ncbi:MAG: glycosyltransferase family 2 protein [Phycisphaerae bacterium]
MPTEGETDRLSRSARCPVEISIVLPVYNEQDALDELYQRLTAVLQKVNRPYELIFIDDCSKDRSVKIIKGLADDDPAVHLLILRRNFGQTPALAAGFDAARGDIIVAMDADLQHTPEEIPRFLRKIDHGYDIVSGWRARRVDNFWIRRIPSLVANRLMKYMSGVDLHDFGTTFKAYRAEVIKNVHLYGELHRFIPALASSVGATICEIPIKNINRPFGKSNYGIGRTIRVMFDLMTVNFLLRYMSRPLQFFGLLGLGSFFIGFCLGLYIMYDKFINNKDIYLHHGPLSLLAVLLVIISCSFISLGLLGEVLSRIYHEATGRRIYFIREHWQGGKKNINKISMNDDIERAD